MPEPTQNYTLAAIEAQAKQIVRAWGQPSSQESEVLAAASVGLAGYALAHLVLTWLRYERHRLETQPTPVMVLDLADVLPDWIRERLEAAGAQVEYDTTPLLRPAADTSWVKLEHPDA